MAKKGEYCFEKLPENIRQMGEREFAPLYIEDYVVTYMQRVFAQEPECAIVILLGQKGEGKARDARFVYGAVKLMLDVARADQAFSKEKWDELSETAAEYFADAQIMGWGCSVNFWSSQIDTQIKKIQQKYFAQEGKFLFLKDLGEKEEKFFVWRGGALCALEGFFIYYEKNPLMQEYMLGDAPKESMEASYQDTVTENVRAVVQKNEAKKGTARLAYGVAGFLLLLMLTGANLVFSSQKKLDSLEKTIETLSAQAEETEGEEGSAPQETVSPEASAEPEETAQAEETLEPAETESVKKTEAPTARASAKNTESSTKTKKEKTTKKKKSSAKKSAAEATEEPAETKGTTGTTVVAASYVVQAGDTLSQIVWRQYHTLACLDLVKAANKIEDSDKIEEGQTLVLPAY